ncbi:putative O-methyltransferase [Gordonia hirsuta DSM 44140 = NBRC 16056]|uniref:Putative O-methyltransferase n=1 Tax=Gordonia hirsuta DSM 44140 = NBRC 16056 TaxID=1121927 RepID=L7L745_9ACTN|nr:O-methyltransferase [Gordonia hirsuta]GAC56759.1 putative O-methyltransferase [Gordonia hirsuta DSM 44140 = NBRC 16056]
MSDTPADRTPRSPAADLAAYADAAILEDETLRSARMRAEELGAATISPAAGALLSLFTRIADAQHVVEIGTGVGVSGLWLLAGMPESGVLTTIDPEPEHHSAARLAFRDAGIAPGRTRLITGAPTDVLTRLADDSYDVVFVDGPLLSYPVFVTESVRILRPGGVVILNNASAGGTIADRDADDPRTLAAREAATLIAEDDRLLPAVVPVGSGLLAAAKAR